MKLVKKLSEINTDQNVEEPEVVAQIKKCVKDCDYTVTELNEDKPWGAYLRFGHLDTKRFLEEFFPATIVMDNLSVGEDVGLSIKLLVVDPGQGLSWQYHNRRSEIWSFITPGAYKRSMEDKQGDLRQAQRGDVVQFVAGERHRLIGREDGYTIVAEIWQHNDLSNLSDEDDIVRLIDDYSRISRKTRLTNWVNEAKATAKNLLNQ